MGWCDLRKVSEERLLTDNDGLDSDALFDMSSVWVIADLVGDDFRLAQRVHKSRASRARSTCKFEDKRPRRT